MARGLQKPTKEAAALSALDTLIEQNGKGLWGGCRPTTTSIEREPSGRPRGTLREKTRIRAPRVERSS